MSSLLRRCLVNQLSQNHLDARKKYRFLGSIIGKSASLEKWQTSPEVTLSVQYENLFNKPLEGSLHAESSMKSNFFRKGSNMFLNICIVVLIWNFHNTARISLLLLSIHLLYIHFKRNKSFFPCDHPSNPCISYWTGLNCAQIHLSHLIPHLSDFRILVNCLVSTIQYARSEEMKINNSQWRHG